MSIGTPYALASQTSSASATSLTKTVTVNAPAGDLVTVAFMIQSPSTPTSVTDSQGNSYTVYLNLNLSNATGRLVIAQSVLTTGLVSGTDSITTHWTTASAANMLLAIGCNSTTGWQSAIDQTANASGANQTQTTGTTSATTSAPELAVGYYLSESGSALSHSSDTTYTNVTSLTFFSSHHWLIGIAYGILSSTGTTSGSQTTNITALASIGAVITFEATNPTRTPQPVIISTAVHRAATW